MEILQERGPVPRPKIGLLSNTRKWIVRGVTCADKARDFTGKGCLVREQEGKGTQNSSVTWLAVSGFMVMGLVSGLFLANHSYSESFLGVHVLFSQMDAREEDSGRWLVMWCLLLTFPELFRLGRITSCVPYQNLLL